MLLYYIRSKHLSFIYSFINEYLEQHVVGDAESALDAIVQW